MINIYKASAGAGKTHKLTGEYIKLLFREPYAYKHILAVTFTNKATDEMKQRILLELHNLSNPSLESGYLSELCEVYDKSQEQIREQAAKVLITILHDYTSFTISTIDKFFQGVMRAFARELGKMATYNVELDSESVVMAAIDRMFADLDKVENKELLQWLIDYSLDAVDAGDSWNIRKEILGLAKELFSEDFKLMKGEAAAEEESSAASSSVSTREHILDFKKSINSIISEFESKLISLGKKGDECMCANGVAYTDFKGGSRSPFKYFITLKSLSGKIKITEPTQTFAKLYNNFDVWYSGKKPSPALLGAYDGGLNELVGEILIAFEREFRVYSTAKVLLGNLNALGILDDIYRRVLEYCKEKNIILLSESTEVLNKIIDGSDTPFIYEKIGSRIDNFMLDEFQDTSVLQWKNFYPLLNNSLAEGGENLVVGDVKQSIYRWRGSDWKILNSGLYESFRPDEVANYSLDCNWRSGKNIIEFNNEFFTYCARSAQQIYNGNVGKTKGADGVDNAVSENLIENIYSNFKQEVSPKGEKMKGYVEVNFMPQGEEAKEENFREDVLELLPNRVAELLESGFELKDIAFLVRKNSHGRAVAERLIAAGYEVISNDSLFISSSTAVMRVINVLREIENPNNPQLKVYKHFSNENREELSHELEGRSLYECCEEIIRSMLLPSEQEEVAFLQAFLDCVLDYTAKEGTDLHGFLKWWDESGVRKTISAPEDQNAINVMTIHKSKGLGFNVVIIPFFSEMLDKSGNRIWCSLKGKEQGEEQEGVSKLNYNSPLPLKSYSTLSNTLFYKEYNNEMLYNFVDNLNTAYVAFTRPKEQLIIYAQQPKIKKDGSVTLGSVADILHEFYNSLPLNCKVESNEAGVKKITHGEPMVKEKLAVSGAITQFAGVFNSPPDYTRTRTALSSGSINSGETIREYGIAMHYVFSLINSAKDIDEAVQKATSEGISEFEPAHLAAIVKEKIASVAEYGWFAEGAEVLNECDVILPNGDVSRPDRVIINNGKVSIVDYKFGAYEEHSALENKYKRQVRAYMNLFEQMGYEEVEGYLWYPENTIIIGVD